MSSGWPPCRFSSPGSGRSRGSPTIPSLQGVAIDPYAVYRRLRERDPIHRMKLVDAWVLTRYEDADAMLRDHRRFANDGRQRCLPRRADRDDVAERRGGGEMPGVGGRAWQHASDDTRS